MTVRASTTAAAVLAAAAIAGCGGGSSGGLSDKFHKDFVAGCTTSQTKAGCECIYDQLKNHQGVDTEKKMVAMKNEIQAAGGDPRKMPANYKNAVIACKDKLHG